MSTTDIFTTFQDYLNEDQDLREKIRTTVRELEQKYREIQTLMQLIHHPQHIKNIPDLVTQAQGMFTNIRTQYALIAELIPPGQFYRYHDHWRNVTQRLCFLAALITYLNDGSLLTRESLASLIGVQVKREDGFHIDLDDFLMGLLIMANELSRLSVNAVTSGDYRRPRDIAVFVSELDAGFRLLNLKNDSLRKKFDGLKYDLKKCEEIVYDLSLRELRPVDDEPKD